jgi:hypothetical protein
MLIVGLSLKEADDAELTSLLKVMVLLGEPPVRFLNAPWLSPQHIELIARGQQLRAQLPAYMKRQWALVVEHCPLPTVLLPLVVDYAAPTYEDI